MHLEANTQITPFTFHGHDVRVFVANDGEPRFVLNDLCKVLGMSNPRMVRDRLQDDDVSQTDVTDSLGRIQTTNVVTEAGMYDVVLRSDKPEALQFRKFVTREVLPSIRKHGAYMTEATIEQVLTDPDTLIKLATDLKAERARRAELEHQAALDAPKVVFADAVAVSKTAILVGDLAKILRGNGVQVGGTRLFAWMRANGFLINRKGMDWNMPTQRAMELELFKVKETVVTHSDGHTSISKTPKITGKGQRYFIERFLDGRFLIDAAA